MMSQSAEKIANSTIVLAMARASMVLALPTIGALFWAYTSWQEEKLSNIDARLTIAQSSADSAAKVARETSDRMIAVEMRQQQSSADYQRFQTEMLSRMDRMQDAIIGLSNSVSGLTATVQALAENQRRDQRQPP